MREDQLDNADQNFYTTAGYLLAMFECSERLFEVASIDEKREIVSLLLSNLRLDGKNFTFNLKEPFATLISQSKGSSWLEIVDAFQEHLEGVNYIYELINFVNARPEMAPCVKC